MGETIKSLEEVSAAALPASVLVLLSKYAQATIKHTGLVIKISSMNVFKHVHSTQKLTRHPAVKQLQRELLLEVSSHIAQGTMHSVRDRDLIDRNRAANTNSAELLVATQ